MEKIFIRSLAFVILSLCISFSNLSAQILSTSHSSNSDYENIFAYPDSVIYSIYKNHKIEEYKDNLALSIYLLRLSSQYIRYNHHKEAIDLIIYSQKVIEDSIALHNKYYEYAKSLLYKAYDETNQYFLVEDYVFDDIEEIWDKKDRRYVEYLQNLGNQAHSLYHRGYFDKAIKIYETQIQLFKKIRQDKLVPKSMMELALCYRTMGKYQLSLDYGIQSQSLAEKLNFSIQSLIYFKGNNAISYALLGDLKRAKFLIEQVRDTTEKEIGKNNLTYATSLLNLAAFLYKEQDYYKALDYLKEVKNIYDNIKIDDSSYSKLLNLLASNYSQIEEYNLALQYINEALLRIKKVTGTINSEYSTYLKNKAEILYQFGNTDQAFLCAIDALLIENGLYGVHSNNCANLFNMLSKYSRDSIQSALYYQDAFKINRKNLVENFMTMTPFEQKLYWQNSEKFISQSSYNIACHSDSQISHPVAYDAALLAKGLLLQSEISFKDIIFKSNDTKAQELLTQLEDINKQIEKINYAATSGKRLDSLRFIRNQFFNNLIKENTMSRSFIKDLSLTWEDVKQNMGNGETAIEFIKSGSNYAAIVLTKSMKYPRMIELFTEDQILNIDIQEERNFKILYDLIWEPLNRYLNVSKYVYFSPVGELYGIPIEVIAESVFPNIRFIRLSSTRELCSTRLHNISNKKLFLCGGFNYNSKTEYIKTIESDSLETQEVLSRDLLSSLRGVSFHNLPGTYREIINISNLAKTDSNYKLSILTGKEGTERNFLTTIKETVPQIIHLATHGFYWNKDKADSLYHKFNLSFLSNCLHEDKSLSRSGLIFSGANTVIQENNSYNGPDDGVLTSAELSKLNLRGCELVVLSACQTGLGDVSYEGVFGLQRGLKQAGARSILMSLWNVSDMATSVFMSEFYKQYFKSNNSQLAITKAREFMKNSKQFSHPKYWAGFILLDAISDRSKNKNILNEPSEVTHVEMKPIESNDSILFRGIKFRCILSMDYPINDDSQSNTVKDFILHKMIGSEEHQFKSGVEYFSAYSKVFLDSRKDIYRDMTEEEVNGYKELGEQYLNETLREIYQNRHIITLRDFNEIYGGGIHPFLSDYTVTLYKSTGKTFGWDSFKDGKSKDLEVLVLKALAIQHFKETYEDAIKSDLWIKSDSLNLPKGDPYITQEGVVFSYEPYEIACFAEGFPKCVIPLALIQPFLKKEFIYTPE